MLSNLLTRLSFDLNQFSAPADRCRKQLRRIEWHKLANGNVRQSNDWIAAVAQRLDGLPPTHCATLRARGEELADTGRRIMPALHADDYIAQGVILLGS